MRDNDIPLRLRTLRLAHSGFYLQVQLIIDTSTQRIEARGDEFAMNLWGKAKKLTDQPTLSETPRGVTLSGPTANSPDSIHLVGYVQTVRITVTHGRGRFLLSYCQ